MTRSSLLARGSSQRWLAIAAAVLIAALLAGSAWVLAHRGPASVSLAQLAASQESYNGRDVQTQGTVVQFQDPDGTVYYVIEDSRPNRVEIEPASAASRYVGQQVTVVGKFHFDDRQGRSIAVAQLNAL